MAGVVQNFQQAKYRLNFDCAKIAVLVGGVRGDIIFLQHFDNLRGGTINRAEQYHNIPKFKRAVAVQIFIPNIFSCAGYNLHFNFKFIIIGRKFGVIFIIVIPIAFCLLPTAYNQNFGAFVKSICACGIICAQIQPRVIVIINFIIFFSHNIFKDEINGVDNIFAGAEIRRKVDFFAVLR